MDTLQKLMAQSQELFAAHKSDRPEYAVILEQIIEASRDRPEYKAQRLYGIFHLAQYHSRKFNFEQARGLYETLMKDPAAENHGNEFFNYGLEAVNSLAYDWRIQKNYPEAIRLYKLLLRKNGERGLAGASVLCLENLALCYEKTGDYEAARRMLDAAFNAYAPAKNSETYVSLKQKTANLYLAEGKYPQARAHAQALLDGCEGGGTDLDYARINALNLIGDSHLAERDYARALPCFEKIRTIAQTDRFFTQSRKEAEKKIQLCIENGQTPA
ncbi:MAG: tetratricopeptide repeat protein [Neisseria sp.]|nr:tetratricopeptide repeat protein [Neisseria sp.]